MRIEDIKKTEWCKWRPRETRLKEKYMLKAVKILDVVSTYLADIQLCNGEIFRVPAWELEE